MRKLQDPVFNAVDAAINKTSSSIITNQTFACSVQVTATGTGINGAVKIQCSNDGTNFADITGATVNIASATTVFILKTEICYAFIRLVYTNSGTPTGTITAVLQTQGV